MAASRRESGAGGNTPYCGASHTATQLFLDCGDSSGAMDDRGGCARRGSCAGRSFVGAWPPALERSLAMRARFFLLAVVAGAVLAPPAHAQRQVIIFKDGFAVEGYVKRDYTSIYDPISGQPIRIPVLGGFYTVDEGARTVIFAPNQVYDVVEARTKKNQIVLTREPPARATEELGNLWQPLAFHKWEIQGMERTVTTKLWNKTQDIQQRITILTPEYFRVQSLTYKWLPHYMTSELDPDTLRKMLHWHLANSNKDKVVSEVERFKTV